MDKKKKLHGSNSNPLLTSSERKFVPNPLLLGDGNATILSLYGQDGIIDRSTRNRIDRNVILLKRQFQQHSNKTAMTTDIEPYLKKIDVESDDPLDQPLYSTMVRSDVKFPLLAYSLTNDIHNKNTKPKRYKSFKDMRNVNSTLDMQNVNSTVDCENLLQKQLQNNQSMTNINNYKNKTDFQKTDSQKKGQFYKQNPFETFENVETQVTENTLNAAYQKTGSFFAQTNTNTNQGFKTQRNYNRTKLSNTLKNMSQSNWNRNVLSPTIDGRSFKETPRKNMTEIKPKNARLHTVTSNKNLKDHDAYTREYQVKAPSSKLDKQKESFLGIVNYKDKSVLKNNCNFCEQDIGLVKASLRDLAIESISKSHKSNKENSVIYYSTADENTNFDDKGDVNYYLPEVQNQEDVAILDNVSNYIGNAKEDLIMVTPSLRENIISQRYERSSNYAKCMNILSSDNKNYEDVKRSNNKIELFKKLINNPKLNKKDKSYNALSNWFLTKTNGDIDKQNEEQKNFTEEEEIPKSAQDSKWRKSMSDQKSVYKNLDYHKEFLNKENTKKDCKNEDDPLKFIYTAGLKSFIKTYFNEESQRKLQGFETFAFTITEKEYPTLKNNLKEIRGKKPPGSLNCNEFYTESQRKTLVEEAKFEGDKKNLQKYIYLCNSKKSSKQHVNNVNEKNDQNARGKKPKITHNIKEADAVAKKKAPIVVQKNKDSGESVFEEENSVSNIVKPQLLCKNKVHQMKAEYFKGIKTMIKQKNGQLSKSDVKDAFKPLNVNKDIDQMAGAALLSHLKKINKNNEKKINFSIGGEENYDTDVKDFFKTIREVPILKDGKRIIDKVDNTGKGLAMIRGSTQKLTSSRKLLGVKKSEGVH